MRSRALAVQKRVLRRVREHSIASTKIRSLRAELTGFSQRKIAIADFDARVALGGKTSRKLHVFVDSVSDQPDVDGAALLQIEALDPDGIRIPIPNWPHVSKRVNEYVYLTPGSSATPSTQHIVVSLPEDVQEVRLTGHPWKTGVATVLLGDPIICLEGVDPLPSVSPSGVPIAWRGSEFRYEIPIEPGSSQLKLSIYARGNEQGVTPLFVSFVGVAGENEPLPPSDLPVHRERGPYVPVNLNPENEERTQATIKLTSAVERVVLTGAEWGAKTATYTRAPVVSFSFDPGISQLISFLKESPEEPLVVIDTTAPPIGHATLALRPNNLAAAYSELGIRTLFVPFGSTQGEQWILSDHLAQVPRALVDSVVGELSAIQRTGTMTYICSSFPSLECYTRMAFLRSIGWNTIYEARDDMEEFNRVGYSKWYHPLLESATISLSEHVMAVSPALAKKIESMVPEDLVCAVVPNGVNRVTLATSAFLRNSDSVGRRELNRVGYVGHLTPSWFDWPLVMDAARALPEYEFEIVGHGMPDDLVLPANVHYLGPKTHEELLTIVNRWTVGIIPFVESPLTRSVDPNKAYEYYAWGLRVLSAKMGSMETYPSALVYRGVDDFVTKLKELTASPMSKQELELVDEFARKSSWDERAAFIANHWGLM